MKKTFKTILILVTLLVFLILNLINSKYIINNFLDYTNLFTTKLLPVSFINFVISSLLIEYGIVELLPINISEVYVFILSLISGFPSGAKYTKELLEVDGINKNEANNIILYSHFPNPMFIFGTINLILNDYNLCLKLFISILFSNFIIFLFTKKKIKVKSNNYTYPHNFSSVLNKAIYSSIKTIILIYGTSIFFYLIFCILTKYIFLDTYLYVFISGLFDLTKGVFSTTLINSNVIKSLFILFFISFGGISIHMQVKSILENTPISYKRFLLGRIIGTIISFTIFLLIIKS